MAADHFSIAETGAELTAKKPKWKVCISSQRSKNKRVSQEN
jgi:hypothetical protein